jgi:UDP-glucose 4-epimerase
MHAPDRRAGRPPDPGELEMKVLISGGAGYIGSTIASCCADAGMTPVILDDLSTGLQVFGDRFDFYRGDIADAALVARVFSEHPDIDAVVHCAAKIVVPESVTDPLMYYDNNVGKSLTFLREVVRAGCSRVLFSSTASMYVPGPDFLVDETSRVDPQSPYAASKQMVERVLADLSRATGVGVLSLRYFNPIGADPQLRTGLQLAAPSHALGKLIEAHQAGRSFTVTGTHWPTRDGSGLRDYIHVWDLARAHVSALTRFDEVVGTGTGGERYDVVNIGTGAGTTVFELVEAFRAATGAQMPVETGPPRPGDVVGCATVADKAALVLGWSAELTLAEAVRDAIAWSDRLHELMPGVG